MIIKKMLKLFSLITILNIFFSVNLYAKNHNFNAWLDDFKIKAINSGISKKVVNDVMSNAKFLPKVIEYDRYQPEFYEDTFTYIKKRTSKKKVIAGKKLYSKEKKVIDEIESKYQV